MPVTALRRAGSARFHERFNAGFDRFRDFYGWLLAGILRRRVLTPLVAGSVVAGAAVISLFVGSDFFPPVDAGLIELHVRAPARTRIERTEQIFHAVEDNIRQQIPQSDLGLVLDNIGLPARLYNLAFTDGSTIGVNDGQIMLQLNEGHAPTADYVKKLRRELPVAFPDVAVLFPAGRHGDTGAEFRRALADRRAGAGPRPRRQPGHRQGAAETHGRHPGHRGCARAAGAGCAGARVHDRPHARPGTRPERQHDRQRREYQPEFVGAGFAEFLDRSEERHSVFFRGADAGIP